MYDDDTPALLAWTAADLSSKLADKNPDQDSFVLRVVAARLAETAGTCGDPLHVVKDLSRAAGSMAEAARAILDREADPDLDADREVVEWLDNAAARLWDLRNRLG